jgi:hypothetical protein
MGMGSSGILAYGYDLGGVEDGWNFPDLEYGQWAPPDVNEDQGDEFDFAEWAEKKLLLSVGVTEDDRSDGWFDRRKEAKELLGVEVRHGGSYDHFRPMLVAWSKSGYGSEPRPIDFTELERRRVEEDWDGKLANAARVLELPKIMVPTKGWGDLTEEQRPHWMLTAFYG